MSTPDPKPAQAPVEIDTILARAEAATPGPWVFNSDAKGGEDDPALYTEAEVYDESGRMPITTDRAFWSDSDFAFIAHARTDIPALVARCRALEAERDHDGKLAEDAFGEIAALCDCPQWEYPGQVIRDVQLLKAERDAARAEADAFRDASGLVGSHGGIEGDPGSVKPEHVAAHIASVEKERDGARDRLLDSFMPAEPAREEARAAGLARAVQEAIGHHREHHKREMLADRELEHEAAAAETAEALAAKARAEAGALRAALDRIEHEIGSIPRIHDETAEEFRSVALFASEIAQVVLFVARNALAASAPEAPASESAPDRSDEIGGAASPRTHPRTRPRTGRERRGREGGEDVKGPSPNRLDLLRWDRAAADFEKLALSCAESGAGEPAKIVAASIRRQIREGLEAAFVKGAGRAVRRSWLRKIGAIHAAR